MMRGGARLHLNDPNRFGPAVGAFHGRLPLAVSVFEERRGKGQLAEVESRIEHPDRHRDVGHVSSGLTALRFPVTMTELLFNYELPEAGAVSSFPRSHSSSIPARLIFLDGRNSFRL